MYKVLSSAIAVALIGVSISAKASHVVSGHYRSDGSYVSPHMSMDPYEARNSGYSYHNNQLVPYGEY